jgi:hypothetical protein
VKRALLTFVLATTGLLGAWLAVPAAGSAATLAKPVSVAAQTPDPVIEWNKFLLGIQATAGDQPATVHPTYELAIMHAAIYDAVVAIDHSATPYLTTVHAPRAASRAAAADTAARDTLVALYPGLQVSIDQEYAGLLAQLPSRRHVAEGIRVGEQVAAQLLAARRGDGSAAQPIAFVPGTDAGDYQLTPPAFSPPQFTHWRFVRPFALFRADQFRPGPPPALTGAKYAAAFNEVKSLGAATGSTRTADQTEIGLFWNPPIWATWNRIAETAAVGRHGNLAENARAFAALNLTFADSVIAFYDAKYTYRLWRPITAIQRADTDGNPDTTADPNWTPLSATAPDPSYPGAHGTISAAGAETLASIYGNDFAFDVTSTALAGVKRSFSSFTEAADEATVSRIYNGNHTRIDQVAGENLGRDVAQFVLRSALLRHDQQGR